MLGKSDIKEIIALIQAAELDIARYLQNPEDYIATEYFEGVQTILGDALFILGSNPVPLLED
jgi:hypothetical protein